MSESKSFLRSRTLWWNLGWAGFAVLSEHSELLREYLSEGGYFAVLMLLALGNAFLRSVTQQAVRLK